MRSEEEQYQDGVASPPGAAGRPGGLRPRLLGGAARQGADGIQVQTLFLFFENFVVKYQKKGKRF